MYALEYGAIQELCNLFGTGAKAKTLPSDSLNLQNVTYLEIYGSVVESSDANGRSNVLGMERRDGYVVLCAGSSTFLQQFQKLAQS